MIVLAGIIGAGKTSLAKILGEELQTKVFYESVQDNPVLDLYYKDPKKYAFLLQIFFLNRRFKSIKEANQSKNSILDRSIFEDALFLHLNYKNGNVSQIEFDTYQDLLHNMLEELDQQPKKTPDILIYIDVSLEKMLERIQKRGRAYEQVTDHSELLDYYKQLHEEYKQWFDQYNHSYKIRIDGNAYDFIDNPKDKTHIITYIKSELAQLNII